MKRWMFYAVLGATFLVANTALFHLSGEAEAFPVRRPLTEFPVSLENWTCGERAQMDDWAIGILGVTDYLLCNFARSDPAAFVGVYVGYHASQTRVGGTGRDETGIHPPKHCLPGSGWDIIEAATVSLDLPGFDSSRDRVNRFVISKGNQRQLVYYWYHSRGRVIASDWKKVVYLAWDRALLQRTDGSLVRFTVPIRNGDTERAEAEVLDVAQKVVARLPDFLPN